MSQSYLEALYKEFVSPSGWDPAGAVGSVMQSMFESNAALAKAAASGSAALATKAAQEAAIWQRVNSSFVPANRIEQNMLRVGQQIEQGLQSIRACMKFTARLRSHILRWLRPH